MQIGVEDSRLFQWRTTLQAVTAVESLSTAAITLQVLTATQLERDITTECTLYILKQFTSIAEYLHAIYALYCIVLQGFHYMTYLNSVACML